MLLHILLSIVITGSVLGAALIILLDDGETGRKIAWLLIIGVFPVIGLVLYLLFGLNPRHHLFFERRRRRFTDAVEAADLGPLIPEEVSDGIDERYRPLARMLARDPFETPSGGNSIELITTGDRKYHLLLEDLASAREYIHIEYFHFGNDKGGRDIRDMLVRKASEGVKVRFLNENIGNFPIRPGYYDDMKKAGVDVVRFTNPRRHIIDFITKLNYRNHRKIVVIDGRVGYTGGMNINDKYFLRWRDTHLRITGPAVCSLQYIFLESWITAGGDVDRPLSGFFSPRPVSPPASESAGQTLDGQTVQIVADEPHSLHSTLQMSYEWALYNAKDYCYLQTPYFAPPEPVLNALKSAALAGVDVRVMLPRESDTPLMRPVNRSYYKECLQAGVRIFERSGKFIHSKTFVSDDYISCIGTTNIDSRSFSINYEDNAYVYGRDAALMCRRVFMDDLGLSREIKMPEVLAWPWYKTLGQRVLRLFAALL